MTRAGRAARRSGSCSGSQCTLHPLLTNPVYREIADLPLAERVAIDARPGVQGARARRRRRAERAPTLGGRLLQAFDRMFELGDPPDYEPDAGDRASPARADARAATPLDLAYDLLLARRRAGVPLPAVPQLRRRQPRRGRRDARAPQHRRRPRRRRRARRHDLRRELPHDAADALGPRPRPRPARPAVRWCSARRSATARAVGLLDRGVLAPGYRADVNVIDFERLARAPTRDAPRPARRRQAARAARPTATSRRSSPARSRTRTAKPRGPLPGPPRPRPAARARLTQPRWLSSTRGVSEHRVHTGES